MYNGPPSCHRDRGRAAHAAAPPAPSRATVPGEDVVRFEEQVKVPVSQAEAGTSCGRRGASRPACPAVPASKRSCRASAIRRSSPTPSGPTRRSSTSTSPCRKASRQTASACRRAARTSAWAPPSSLLSRVALRGVAPRVTVLDVTADVQILGKIAALGQFAIKRKAKDVVQRFAQNVAAELEQGAALPPSPPPMAGGAYPVLAAARDRRPQPPPPIGGGGFPTPPSLTPPAPPLPSKGRGAGGLGA